MPELPRLDYLVRLTYAARNNRHGIFKSNPWYGCVQKRPNKVESIALLNLLFSEPTRTGNSQVSAWRVSHHDIPTKMQAAQYVGLEMKLTGILGLQ
jgi:hypothetical protein